MKENFLENQEQEPEVHIDFDPEPFGAMQKFITAKTESGDTFIASYPYFTRHSEILRKLQEETGNEEIQATGGGFLMKYNDTVTLSGKSLDYGPYNKPFVTKHLQEKFEDLEIENE